MSCPFIAVLFPAIKVANAISVAKNIRVNAKYVLAILKNLSFIYFILFALKSAIKFNIDQKERKAWNGHQLRLLHLRLQGKL